jgi:hypothetical protein
MKPELLRFWSMASTGEQSWASSGEVRAYRLAQAVIDNIGGLDDGAAAGFLEFIRLVRIQGERATINALRAAQLKEKQNANAS